MSARSSTLLEISENSEGYLFSETGYLKFTPDSKALFAASQDGIIFKYDFNDSNKLDNMTECSKTTLHFSEKISKISVSNSDSGCLATASDSHELVRLYRIGENGQFEGPKLVTKCAGSTDSLAINPSGTILCCSGKDNNVKVINIKDGEFPVLSQFPMDHFVKSISFSENGNQMALLQVDGLLKIFKIIENNPAPQLFKTLTGPKRNMKGKFQISWKGSVLGVLYGGQILKFFDSSSDDFKVISEFEIFETVLNYFELFSKNCALLSSENDKISIFSIGKNQIIKSISYENIKNSSIAAVNENLAFIFDSTKSDLFAIKISIDSSDLISSKMKSDDKKKKLETLKKKNKFIDDSCEDEGEDEDVSGEDPDNEGSSEDMNDDRSDIGVGFSDDDNEEDDNSDNINDINDMDNVDEIDNMDRSKFNNVVIKKHPAIQPCCTPFRNMQRYLTYNNVGFITCRQELGENLFKYDIEFMDRSSHQPIRFEEGISYDLAALCEKGAVFASKGVGAELKYKSFENSEESWNFPLSLGTEPILLGINSHNVYLVNNRGILNIFSLTGLLRSSVTCPGRPVSLTCSESDEIFMFTEDSEGILCHRLDAHNGGLVKGSQNSRVLLGSTDQLTWCGLSFSNVLGVYTSEGKFSILLTRGNDRWTEILGTLKSTETAWPVYFDVNTLSSITCTDKFPDPYPAPIVIDTNFRIPEFPSDSFSESYEEIVRTNWILNETSSTGLTDREKKKIFASADRHLLELAQISIKANRLNRLIDLARWASNEKTIELLIQLAKHHKLATIIHELENIKMELFHLKPKTAAINNISHNTIISDNSRTGQVFNTEDIANTTFTGTTTSTSWSTPHLPEMVAKESPSGILANLTPMKTTSSASVADKEIASSPAEFVSSPSNPFAKTSKDENVDSIVTVNEGNAMLDYISAMMKMNNSGGKRKAEDNNNNASNKKSSLSSNVFANN